MNLTTLPRLLLLALLGLLFAIPVHATDVTIAAFKIKGFSPANLGQPINVNATVTNGSSIVTSTAAFRSAWVGIGGFTVLVNGSEYVVRDVETTSVLNLTTNYVGSSGPMTVSFYPFIEVRIYADKSFYPAGSTKIVLPGAPNGGGPAFRRYAASVVNEAGVDYLRVPEMTLFATTDGTPTNQARIRMFFHRPDGALVGGAAQTYTCGSVDAFRIPTTTPTSWKDICAYNAAPQIVLDPNKFYTTQEIDARMPSCAAAKLAGYTSIGRALACIALGAGLSLDVNTATLSATAATRPDAATFIYATDYGMVCDGSTDDTGALNTAQGTANAAGKRLILPAGTCRISQLILTDNDWIEGAGLDKTILKSVTNQPIVTVTTSATNAHLEKLTITGTNGLGSQTGINLAGSADYSGLIIRDVYVRNTGSHGISWSTRPFSSGLENVHVSSADGFPLLYDSQFAPNNVWRDIYVHVLRGTNPVAYRIKSGRLRCENCNGTDNVPPIAGTRWAVLGKRIGVDGDAANIPAYVEWVKGNIEAFDTVGIDHYSFSASTIKECTFAGTGNVNQVALQYDVDDALGIAFAAYHEKGTIDDRSDFGDGPETNYKNGSIIHSNNIPPLLLDGQGTNIAGDSPLGFYYDTVRTQRLPLMRADGFSRTVSVTSNTSFPRPGLRYLEVNCSAACQQTLPWPGWYSANEELVVKDISGAAFTNPITLFVNGGGTIQGVGSHTIKLNYGWVRLLPNSSGTDWRIVGTTTPEWDFSNSAFKSPLRWWGGNASAAAPAFSFTNDFTSGLYLVSNGNLGVAAGGNQRLQVGNDVQIFPYGASTGQTGTLRLFNLATTGSVSLRAHDTSTSYALTFPQTLPGATECVQLGSTGAVTTSGRACGQPAPLTFSTLGTPSNGNQAYCSDCKVTSGVDNTCASAGTGALAVRLNGAWKCFQ